MTTLVHGLAYGTDRCDANSLNYQLRVYPDVNESEYYVSNQLPQYCQILLNHQFTGKQLKTGIPMYVGEPNKGGFWVNSKNFDQQNKKYKQRLIAQEKSQIEALRE